MNNTAHFKGDTPLQQPEIAAKATQASAEKEVPNTGQEEIILHSCPYTYTILVLRSTKYSRCSTQIVVTRNQVPEVSERIMITDHRRLIALPLPNLIREATLTPKEEVQCSHPSHNPELV